jgi:hypothetical protein
MTTLTATTPGTILAIDLGRYKSVACAYDRATTAARFHTIESTRAAVARLFVRHPGAVVVVEACANAGWVHDLALERGLTVRVANTNGEAWKFKHLKRKTDRDNAHRLAELVIRLTDLSTPNRATFATYPGPAGSIRGGGSPAGARPWEPLGLARGSVRGCGGPQPLTAGPPGWSSGGWANRSAFGTVGAVAAAPRADGPLASGLPRPASTYFTEDFASHRSSAATVPRRSPAVSR